MIALLSASSSGIAVPAAFAATVHTQYSVSYLGVRIGKITIVNEIGPSTYQADFDAHSTGAAGAVRSFRITMKANGLVREAALQPAAFSASQSGAEVRSVRLSLTGGNATTAEIDPPFETQGPLVPVTDDHKRNVVDPLSAFIMPLPSSDRASAPAACNRTLRLFTGVTRSDITFAPVKMEQVTSRAYSGPVAVCSVRYLPISGHNPDSTMTSFMTANRGIEVRLAALPDLPLAIVVSAKVPLPLGTAIVDLQHYEVVPTPDRTRR